MINRVKIETAWGSSLYQHQVAVHSLSIKPLMTSSLTCLYQTQTPGHQAPVDPQDLATTDLSWHAVVPSYRKHGALGWPQHQLGLSTLCKTFQQKYFKLVNMTCTSCSHVLFLGATGCQVIWQSIGSACKPVLKAPGRFVLYLPQGGKWGGCWHLLKGTFIVVIHATSRQVSVLMSAFT